MILSKKWLMGLNPEFAIINSDNMTVALNCLGQELEGTKVHYKVNDLCVGYVENFQPHPNSDHLNVVTIKTKNDTRTIVCGAPNMYKDKYVCVANVGSTMVNGLTLVAKPLRGVDSHGMICAFHELTNMHNDCLSTKEKENVIFLDNDANFETNIYEYLGLNDEMYDIFIQANRNDLNGAYYLGKNLAAYFDIEYPEIKAKLPKVKGQNLIIDNNNVFGSGLLKIKTNNQGLTWKYKSTLINGAIKVQDNISDYASYLSYLFAIPYIAIDASKVQLPFTITKANDEVIWNVNDKKITIRKGDTIVVDANNKIVSYANLIANPELVSETANEIYLLTFNADVLETRKLVQFNKISNQNSLLAVKPNTNAMIINSQEFAFDDKLSPSFLKDNTELLSTCKMNDGNVVEVCLEDVNRFLGTNLSYDQYKSILTKYGFEVSKSKVVSSPIRTDSQNIQDIAEDVLVGFNLNDMEVQPISFQVKETFDNTYEKMQNITNYLVDFGFYNAKTYNLTSHENASLFNWYNLPILDLKNPSSNIKASFNTNKIDSLLNVISLNSRAKNNPVNWFEIAKLYNSKDESFNALTIIMDTNWFIDKLSNSGLTNDILNAISIVNNIFKIAQKPLLSSNDLIFNQPISGCYVENSIIIKRDDVILGFIGQINKNNLKNYKINQDVFAISINLDALFASHNKSSLVKPFSNFNDIVRSVNVLIDFDFDFQKLLNEINVIENIINVRVIDKYKDDKGISYIIEYTINNFEKALDSKELDLIQSQVLNIIENNGLNIK